jgi:hypothetical protein
VVVAWLLLALILGIVPFMNGVLPNLGRNLQIAVWASLPLGLMALIQLIYVWRGGQLGEPGLSGLLPDWDTYRAMNESQKTVALSLAIRLTLFGLWTLILVYLGGRSALRGKRLVVLLAVLSWAVLIVVLPVLAGSIDLPGDELEPGTELIDPSMGDPGMMPQDGGPLIIPEGEMGSVAPPPVESGLPAPEKVP